MELKDFTESDQKRIQQGLSEAVITDRKAAEKILALVPQEWIRKIPFFVRGHATTKAVEKIAKEHLDLYAVAKQEGELPEEEKEQLRELIVALFKERMERHHIR